MVNYFITLLLLLYFIITLLSLCMSVKNGGKVKKKNSCLVSANLLSISTASATEKYNEKWIILQCNILLNESGCALNGFGKCNPGLMPGGDRRSTSLHLLRSLTKTRPTRFQSKYCESESPERARKGIIKINQFSFLLY